jgi:hypothetical protein
MLRVQLDSMEGDGISSVGIHLTLYALNIYNLPKNSYGEHKYLLWICLYTNEIPEAAREKEG